MKRRQYLITTGSIATAVIAGCSSAETEGDDDNPIDAEPEDLLPSADLFGDDWEQSDTEGGGLHALELEGDTASASFNTDQGREGVDVGVTVFDSVEGATSGYQEMRDVDFEAPDLAEDVGVASEGHLMDFEDATVYFRDANVIGGLLHVNTRGSSNPEEHAANWHETWRD